VGIVMHECESEMICAVSHETNMIPYFNAGIFLENKKKIGKVDEIFGPVTKVMFTVKPDPGIHAKSFQPDDKMYIGTDKLLPLTRFTNPSSGGGGGRGGGRGGARGGGRGGGRGGFGGRSPGGRSFGGRGGRSPGRGFSTPRGGRGGGRGGRGRF
jgi:H/ACA ribonucleoprotein complex subunit 1